MTKKIYSSIENGYLVLVGYKAGDTLEIGIKMIDKLLNLRLFSDSHNKINLNIFDTSGKILFVSQFTLYASLKKGNRPSFIEALNADDAISLYHEMFTYLNSKIETKKGVFAAHMEVLSINDGPVTIILDSDDLF